MSHSNRTVVVAKRASGIPGAENFKLVDLARPAPPPGGAVVRIRYAAVDPAMRGWLSAEPNYFTVPDGEVMRSHAVGEVVESDSAHWRTGDWVYGFFGWQEFYAATEDQFIWKIDRDIAPAPVWLGPLGLNGITAWLGFRHFARPKAGETVLVSTAAGGVGSVVGQLAKAGDVRAVGLTSGSDKVALAIRDFGYEKAIDYKAAGDLTGSIALACPQGVDISYDNVGGEISDSVFANLNRGARIIQCGTASIESWIPTPAGPRREREMLVKRLSWNGFVALDHRELFPAALADLTDLYRQQRLKSRQELLEGLGAAPAAVQRLYSGQNHGRLCIAL